MNDRVPLFLQEATISLYPAEGWAAGQAAGSLTGQAVWSGALANRFSARLELEGLLVAGSGDACATEHHLDEQHLIEIDRTWILRRADLTDWRPGRNQQYVLDLIWYEARAVPGTARCWYQRTYYGVTGRGVRLESVGVNQLTVGQSFRAQRYEERDGTLGPIYTPRPSAPGSVPGWPSTPGVPGVGPTTPAGGAEAPVGFFRENALVPGEYLLGTYRWDGAARLGTAAVTAWPSQGQATVLGLELDGTLVPGATVTIPAGPANTDVTASADLGAVRVAAGQTVRWRIVSGPEAETAAWAVALTLGVVV